MNVAPYFPSYLAPDRTISDCLQGVLRLVKRQCPEVGPSDVAAQFYVSRRRWLYPFHSPLEIVGREPPADPKARSRASRDYVDPGLVDLAWRRGADLVWPPRAGLDNDQRASINLRDERHPINRCDLERSDEPRRGNRRILCLPVRDAQGRTLAVMAVIAPSSSGHCLYGSDARAGLGSFADALVGAIELGWRKRWPRHRPEPDAASGVVWLEPVRSLDAAEYVLGDLRSHGADWRLLNAAERRFTALRDD